MIIGKLFSVFTLNECLLLEKFLVPAYFPNDFASIEFAVRIFAIRSVVPIERRKEKKEKKGETERLGNKFLIAINFSPFFVRTEYKGGGSN